MVLSAVEIYRMIEINARQFAGFDTDEKSESAHGQKGSRVLAIYSARPHAKVVVGCSSQDHGCSRPCKLRGTVRAQRLAAEPDRTGAQQGERQRTQRALSRLAWEREREAAAGGTSRFRDFTVPRGSRLRHVQQAHPRSSDGQS